jgi:small subunit ribosomal protein S27Ae
MMKREVFKVEGDKIVRQRKSCPKCGDGVFLGDHKDRLSCGKCGYTEFKPKKEQPQPTEKPEKQDKPHHPEAAKAKPETPPQ